MRFLRQLRSVLWSFAGVRRGADSARDLEGAKPVTIVAAGLVVGAAFVLAIVGLVHLVTGTRADAPSPAPGVASTIRPAERLPGPAMPGTPPDTMAERMRACTSCHGSATEVTGRVFSPRIAGKPADYLFNQLQSFRDGRRTYGPMVAMVRFMDDAYLRAIADHFASLDLPYPAPEPATLAPAALARVRDLVERGDSGRDVPACATCHGASLMGREPAIPGLLGLPRDYMAFQFGAWRNGEVRSRPPDCMGEIARRLAPEDVPALAAWLAAQPVPPGAKPAPPGGAPLPMACGSAETAPPTRDPLATPVASSPQAERGRYLVAVGDCIACHTVPGGAPFAGGRGIDTPFGTVRSTNLTPDEATGLERWTADDFWRAMHDGRSKDGRLLYPAFPYPNFTRVTREDSDAMFAFLRTLAPVARANQPHALRFPFGTQLALAAWRALYFRPGTPPAPPGKSAAWQRGAYLVHGLGHCDACHAERNAFGAVTRGFDLGGGTIPRQEWYAPPLAASSGGLPAWTQDELEALLRTGTAPRGTAMGPMAEVVARSTRHLTAEDARSIATYLRDPLPAERQSTGVAREVATPAADVLARGGIVYREHCADCHGARGESVPPAYPALAGNASASGPSAANAIKAVLYGGFAPVTAGNPRPYGMPAYFTTLRDADVAAVLTYVRASWGNAGTPVSTLDVERHRTLR